MINFKKIIAAALITSVVATVGCTSTPQTTEERMQTVVATISDTTITIGDLYDLLSYDVELLKEEFGEDFENNLDEDTQAQWESALEYALSQLVEEQILLSKYESEEYKLSDEELQAAFDAEYNNYLEYYNGEEGLLAQMETFNLTKEEFDELLYNQVKCRHVVSKIVENVEVTDEDVQSYYDNNKEDFKIGPGADVKHILFSTEEAAIKAREEIIANNNFDEVYELYADNVYGEDETIAETLGFVEYDDVHYLEDFRNGIKELKAGDISEPIKTSAGYHIVSVLSTSDSDVYTEFEEVKDSIKSFLSYTKESETYANTIEEWKKDMKVKEYPNKL